MRIPLAIALLLSSGTLFAGGIQLNLLGCRQLGMGHTGTGIALDGANLVFNPGSIGFLPKRVFQVAGLLSAPATTYLAASPSPDLTQMEPRVFSNFQLYTTWRKRDESPLTLGMAIYSPFGTLTRWPNEWNGRFISQEYSVNSLFFQPTLSFRFNEKWGIGAGAFLATGNTTRRFALPFEVQGGGEPIADPIFASARLRGSGMGIGGSIGIYFQPSALVSLGLNFRSGTTLDIQEGEANFDVPSSLEQQFPSSTFQTTLQLPGSINFGLGYRPSDELTVTMDANYVLWETTSNTIIEFEETLPNFEYPGSADLGYQNTIVIRMGAEYHLSDDVYVRAGTFFDQSPVTDGFVSPELPDANTVGFTGGVSFQVTDNLGLDMTFQFETTGERTTFFEDRRFGGTYQSNNTVIGLGLVWKY